MQTIREYKMAGDGIQAPGAVVIRHNPSNVHHPYVVHFRNDQDGGYSGGNYCPSLESATQMYHKKILRYDPTGRLHAATV